MRLGLSLAHDPIVVSRSNVIEVPFRVVILKTFNDVQIDQKFLSLRFFQYCLHRFDVVQVSSCAANWIIVTTP